MQINFTGSGQNFGIHAFARNPAADALANILDMLPPAAGPGRQASPSHLRPSMPAHVIGDASDYELCVVNDRKVFHGSMSKETAMNTLSLRVDENGVIASRPSDEADRLIDYDALSIELGVRTPYRLECSAGAIEIADQLASAYAVLRLRIASDFSGREQQAELEKLDSYMGEQIHAFARQYADAVTQFNQSIGSGGEAHRLYSSMQTAIYDRLEQYEAFIDGNPDFADIAGSEHAVLTRHTTFMSTNLRSAFRAGQDSGPVQNGDKGGLYTWDELASIAHAAKSYEDIVQNSPGIHAGMGEEQIGLILGARAIKVDSILKSPHLPETYKNAILQHNQRIMDEMIDEVNEQLRSAGDGTPGLQVSIIDKIVSAMRQAYAQTDDALKAFLAGVELAQDTLGRQANSTPLRSISGNQFWNSTYGRADYFTDGKVTAQSLMQDLLAFFARHDGLDVCV